MTKPSEKVEDWGKVLGGIIHATEGRVSNYKKLVGEAYKAGNQDLVTLFKGFRKEEEKWLKERRQEKTHWNQDTWEWFLVHRNDQ